MSGVDGATAEAVSVGEADAPTALAVGVDVAAVVPPHAATNPSSSAAIAMTPLARVSEACRILAFPSLLVTRFGWKHERPQPDEVTGVSDASRCSCPTCPCRVWRRPALRQPPGLTVRRRDRGDPCAPRVRRRRTGGGAAVRE